MGYVISRGQSQKRPVVSPPWGGDEVDIHPKINPYADVLVPHKREHRGMTLTDYLIDSLLVLLVLLQIKERELTTRALVRPLVIVGVAVAVYLDGVPTAGNDLVLLAAFALLGALIGVASGQTVLMRRGSRGEALARSGWASAFFWILGMGSRFAFVVWISHGGQSAMARFSAAHSITGAEAWTAALLAMAVSEVFGRAAVQALRRRSLEHLAVPELV